MRHDPKAHSAVVPQESLDADEDISSSIAAFCCVVALTIFHRLVAALTPRSRKAPTRFRGKSCRCSSSIALTAT